VKIIISFLLLFILVDCNVSIADDRSRKEAEKMMQGIGMKKALEQSMEQILNVQLQQNPTLKPFKKVMLKFFEKHMSYESLKPELVEIYSNTFTEAELKEINAFYATDVGKKTIEKMPELMGKGAQIGAKRVQDNIQELQKLLKDESERIEKLQDKQSN